jgi:FAD/FMN-containing dehydrogenase
MGEFNDLTLAGRVATPDDSGWDEARQAWNLAADQRPGAVAFVESAEDVAKVVRFAGAHGHKVAGQGTGHGAFALGPLNDEDTTLIKTERMRGVEVDADAQTARVDAGVLALELGEAAHKEGLYFLPGSSPNEPPSAPMPFAPTATGPPRSLTRSPRSPASSARRRCPTSQSRFATGR